MQSDQMKAYYDSHGHEGQPLNKGSAVWLYNPRKKKGLSPKLQRSWEGPYVVIKKINDLVYRIQLGPRTKPKVVHCNRLWLYSGTAVPTWFNEGPGEQELTCQEPAQQDSNSPDSNSPDLNSQDSNSRDSSTNHRYPHRSRQCPALYGID